MYKSGGIIFLANKMNKKLKIFIISLISLAVLTGALFFWLYSGSLSPIKTNFFKTLNLPIAFINNKPLLMKDYILRYETAKIINKSQNLPLSDIQIKQQSYNSFINDSEILSLAGKFQVVPSQRQINSEYELQKNATKAKGQGDLETLTKMIGLNESDYKNQVIKPGLAEINLKIWFNSQRELNLSKYLLADDLVNKITSGSDMGLLAKEFSEDETEQSTGGDLGFVNNSNVLMELREALDSMAVGATKISASRFGIHILRLEQKNGSEIHLREIFLKANGFDSWLSQKKSEFKIKKLLTNF
jgi:hypothetical protein